MSFLQRSTTDSEGAFVYVVITVTPGNGHPIELQSGECTGCNKADFTPFDSALGECADSHSLRRPLPTYNETWTRSAASPSGWATIPDSKLVS